MSSIVLLLGLAATGATPPDGPDAARWVYVGTYTKAGGSRGIYRMAFDPASGKLGAPEVAAELTNPSFLAVHPTKRFLYAVNEVSEFGGKPAGSVTGFALDPATGALAPLNRQPTVGAGPCHLSVDAGGSALLVANYGGGSVASLPIGPDGRLAPAASFLQHTGSGTDPGRQKEPHAHSINVDPSGKFAVAADLGLDKVFVYRLDAAKATLAPNDPASASVPPGSGPRHFAFHPDGKHAYVINELKSTVTAFAYDAATGVLTPGQTISTLPDDFKGASYTAEVKVHPSGRFVYGSNRGHDSLAVFAVDPKSGRLTAVDRTPTGGKTPRNFNIDPSGRFLLAANQDTGNVVVFAIDRESGKLTPTEQSASIPMPVCVVFVPKAGFTGR